MFNEFLRFFEMIVLICSYIFHWPAASSCYVSYAESQGLPRYQELGLNFHSKGESLKGQVRMNQGVRRASSGEAPHKVLTSTSQMQLQKKIVLRPGSLR